jgi:hypothetical protein
LEALCDKEGNPQYFMGKVNEIMASPATTINQIMASPVAV